MISLVTFSQRNYKLKWKRPLRSFKLVRLSNFSTLSYCRNYVETSFYPLPMNNCLAKIWQLKENLKFEIKIILNKANNIYQKGLYTQLPHYTYMCVYTHRHIYSYLYICKYSGHEMLSQSIALCIAICAFYQSLTMELRKKKQSPA